MSKTAENFATLVLGHLNKDEETVQQESVLDTIEDYKIQCQTQIGFLETGEIPKLKLQLSQEQRGLKKAEKELEESYLKLGKNFQTYIKNITKAEDALVDIQENVALIEADIEDKQAQIAKYKDLLEKLSA